MLSEPHCLYKNIFSIACVIWDHNPISSKYSNPCTVAPFKPFLVCNTILDSLFGIASFEAVEFLPMRYRDLMLRLRNAFFGESHHSFYCRKQSISLVHELQKRIKIHNIVFRRSCCDYKNYWDAHFNVRVTSALHGCTCFSLLMIIVNLLDFQIIIRVRCNRSNLKIKWLNKY